MRTLSRPHSTDILDLPVKRIRLGNRHRRDMGDLRGLALSIKERTAGTLGGDGTEPLKGERQWIDNQSKRPSLGLIVSLTIRPPRKDTVTSGSKTTRLFLTY